MRAEVGQRERVGPASVGQDEGIAAAYCSVEGASVVLGELGGCDVDVTGDEGHFGSRRCACYLPRSRHRWVWARRGFARNSGPRAVRGCHVVPRSSTMPRSVNQVKASKAISRSLEGTTYMAMLFAESTRWPKGGEGRMSTFFVACPGLTQIPQPLLTMAAKKEGYTRDKSKDAKTIRSCSIEGWCSHV